MLRTNMIPNPSLEVDLTGWTASGVTLTRSNAWAGVGSWSALIQPSSASNDSYVAVGGDSGGGLRLGMVAGKTYTVSAIVNTPTALSGSLHARARKIVVFTHTAAGGYVEWPSAAGPVTGSGRVSATFTIPTNADETFIRLYNGATNSAANSVYWDAVLLETGNLAVGGTYFDGDTKNGYWSGAAHETVSALMLAPLATTTVRLNLVPNPSFGTDLAGWAGGGIGYSSGTMARSQVHTLLRPYSMLITWPASASQSSAVNIPFPTVVGKVYTVSAYVWVPTGSAGVWVGELYIGGSAVTATRDAWVRLSYTFTATGTVHYLAVVAPTGTVGGETCYVNATLAEVGSAAGVWFDGTSLNATWVGTDGNSTSMLSVISNNPNLPLLEVAMWPGVNPALSYAPSSQPSIITDRVRKFRAGRGRQYELAQDETGSGAAQANNSDGVITAGSNGCMPMTSTQVLAQWAGVVYPVFTGYAKSWPQDDDDPARAWSDIELVDAFEALANLPMQTTVGEALAKVTPAPTLYYPMSEPSSSTSMGNVIPGTPWPSAPLVLFKTTAGTGLGLGGSAFLPGSSSTCMIQANATGATGLGSQYQVVGPQNRNQFLLDFTKPWAVSLFVKMTAGRSLVWSALDQAGNTVAYIDVDATGTGQVVFNVNGAGGTAPVTGLKTSGVYVVMGYDGATFFIRYYMSDDNLNHYSAGTYDLAPYTMPAEPSRWVAWGCAFDTSNIKNSSNADMELAHGMMWLGSVPDRLGTQWQDVADAGLTAYVRKRADEQLAQIAKFAGYPSGMPAADSTESVLLWALRDLKGMSALDAMRNVALDVLGRVFVDASGALRYLGRHAGYGATPKWTIGGAAGEYPYTGSPRFAFDPTYVYNDVEVTRQSTSGSSDSTSAVQRWTDATSQGGYFRRPLQMTSNVATDEAAQNLAQWLTNQYRQPKRRVATVKFVPSSNQALWPFVLGAELGDTVTMNHRTVARGTTTLSLQIQRIDHDYDAAAGEWVTTMELSPWASDWVLAAMHTTVQANALAGAASVVLNPLPDSATNPAEASLGVGSTITLSKGTAREETLTIATVTSQPTAKTAGYTTFSLTFTTVTGFAHNAGDVCCDPLPAGVTDPTKWDPWSALDSTTIASF